MKKTTKINLTKNRRKTLFGNPTKRKFAELKQSKPQKFALAKQQQIKELQETNHLFTKHFESTEIQNGFMAFKGRLKKMLKVRTENQIHLKKIQNQYYIEISRPLNHAAVYFLVKNKEIIDAIKSFESK